MSLPHGNRKSSLVLTRSPQYSDRKHDPLARPDQPGCTLPRGCAFQRGDLSGHVLAAHVRLRRPGLSGERGLHGPRQLGDGPRGRGALRLPVALGVGHSSVGTSQVTFWRRMFAFAGPAYLVSVGYMDPGNWATDLEGGARFGYQLPGSM